MRIAEVVSPAATFNTDATNADSERFKAQQRAAKAAAKSAKHAALTLKLRKTQQQLSQLTAS